MKALHLIVVMALAYSGALAYLYFVFRLMLLIGEVVYERSNIRSLRRRKRIDLDRDM